MQTAAALIIFLVVLVLFIWQRIPAGLTAILGALLMMAFGIITPAQLTAPFGSDTVIMVASVLIVGNAVLETGAAARIGRTVVRFTGNNEKLFVCILVIASAVLSAFLSNSAVVAIFLPLLATVAASSQGKITKKGTYMAVGIASVVGGNCTLAGSTPQMTAQAILQSTEGVRPLSFWELGKIGFPLVALLVLYYFFIGVHLQHRFFEEDVHTTEDETEMPAVTDSELGRPGKQITVCAILLLCIVGFTTGVFSFGTVGATAAVLCILTGCISFERAFKTLDWNTICVLAGATALSDALNASGVMDLMAGWMLQAFGGAGVKPVVICTALLVLSSVLGNLMSHTASAAVLVPLAISLSRSMGSDPIPCVVAVVIGCNLAFMTPVATPPLTMTLVGGYRFTDYAKVGALYNVLSVALAAVLIPALYPF